MDKSVIDTPGTSEYVVMGAQTQCVLGAAPSVLMMPMSHGVFLGGKPQCNIMDMKPIMNLVPFGTCNIPAPAPIPCVPTVTGPWVNNMPTAVLIDNQPALIMNANAFCARGGVISIKKSGQ